MIGRLRSLVGRLRAVPSAPAPGPAWPAAATLAQELALAGSDVAEWTAHRRADAGRLYSSLSDDRLKELADRCPEQVIDTKAAADRICRHEFDLLGSGAYVPVDPGRPAKAAYQPIDWYLDPVQKLRFPDRVPYKSWNLLEMRPGLADVKLPWELGRCQHWLPLAQSFALERDERHATEILDQHDDFMEANPVGLGIQWTCTMDVAIRALNWALALELIQSRTTAPAARIEQVYASLFDHGGFIERNLENKYEVTSNHFLSNVVGLYALGVLFDDLPSGRRWIEMCRSWLEQEMRVQVLPDGADYESSVPYHRLVTELFLSGWRLADRSGRLLSGDYRATLQAMVHFLEQVLRPDGTLPQVGDADDGRVHVFSEYGTWDPQNARHLFAPAAGIFGDTLWPAAGDPWAEWEAAWWGLSVGRPGSACSPSARLFHDAGLAVVRNATVYLLISNGKVGTNGFGNHKHNDLLSFEFHHAGTPLIVDPGSFVYTSDPDARNHFRSTKAHNTLTVDDEEQNEFKKEWLFRMFEKAVPEHVEFTTHPAGTRYHGRHDGYARLSPPVVHDRIFDLERETAVLQITDRLRGAGTHAMTWRFHCAPGVAVVADGPGRAVLRAGGREWTLQSAETLPLSIEPSWYSPSYGVRLPAMAASFHARQALTGQDQWTFRVEPRS